ncbi:DUF6461 domain-containing protein [Streptomyces lonarensis]|uniref:Uncharacterized protein n=1 Tax=Streptomyces lonarensis TaxID=700599 RepID=A0A7X6D1Y8_9ACTN|nr:DUF6461 domain-containing protein [Streptomyces lonarensis]NJQ06518.1 hypothetical protein [Streptomyces lonarensis]
MSARLNCHDHLDAPVCSPSGSWSLGYDAGGRAVVADASGTTVWQAGAPGRLELELCGDLVVRQDGEERWRQGLPTPQQIDSLQVTDDGDVLVCVGGDVPVHSLLHGPVETVVLGDRAPFAELGGGRVIRWTDGRRSATVSLLGELREEKVDHRGMPIGSCSLIVSESRRLDRPDTWLTWRFLDDSEGCGWELVLVDADDRVVWALGRGDVDPAAGVGGEQDPAEGTAVLPDPPLPVAESGAYDSAWEEALELDDWYCVTVVRDAAPDQVLTALGAEPAEITTATEEQMQRRCSYEDRTGHDTAAIAFALGPHTLLVESSAWEAWRSPELSEGTLAVTAYSVMGDERFLVSRNGEAVAEYTDGAFGSPGYGDTEAGVIAPALREMGHEELAERNLAHQPHQISDEWDDDGDDEDVDGLELMCRVARVRPTREHVTGAGRVWIAAAE